MKRILSTMLVLALLLGLVGLASAETYTATAAGYNGEMTVEVDLEGDAIKDIRIVKDNESSPVKKRAFPLIIERILEAQTPVVDSVSSASFTSFAVKTAVADALKQHGKEVEEITFLTAGPVAERKDLDAVKTSLLIVGGGPAGLAAAIAASESGVKDLILVEKLDILSGNGKFDMVLFDHINTKAQKEAGIEDSADAFFETRKKAKAWDTDERLRAQADEAVKLDEWFRGMDINLDYVYDNRTHMAEKTAYAGEEIQDGLENRVRELKLDVRTGTKAYDFIMEEGRLAGMKVQHKNEYYDILADAVVIATGGFNWNKDLLKKYAPEGTDRLSTSNSIGASGDMVPLFEQHGFQLGHMENTVVFGLMILPGRELTGERVAPYGSEYILVNKNGKRFTNEAVAYGLPRGLDILDQPESKAYMIFDKTVLDYSFRLGKHFKAGLIKEAASMKELGEMLGVDAEELEKTVAEYNQAAEGKVQDPVRGENKPTRVFDGGPYYGMQIQAAIHMTKGGVVADEKTRILDTDNKVIPGAYAAGEVTDTSGNYSAAIVFGRLAGEEAAKFVLGK